MHVGEGGVAPRGTAHVQTTHTRRLYPQLEPGMTQPQNLFIPADAGEKVTLPGIAITIKVTAASTGNAFAVFEEVTSPGAGPALQWLDEVSSSPRHNREKVLLIHPF